MFTSLPQSALDFMDWPWSQIAPYYQDLEQRQLGSGIVAAWLADWTRISDLISERYARLNIAVTQDTTNAQAEQAYNAFLDEIFPHAEAAEQRLKEKLLASGLEPEGFSLPLRKMRTEAALFREANIPLLSEERKLSAAYDKVIGAQTVIWEGKEITLQQLRPILQYQDRQRRQQAWRLASQRQLDDRQSINDLWGKLMKLRGELAHNAGLPDYRAYRWREMLRLDYSPADCEQFQQAIEQVAVPAASRVYERHRQNLGYESLRPWDLDQELYPVQHPVISPYGSLEDLISGADRIFQRLDPQLGEYFHIMRQEKLLDLDNRKGKAPGGYCTSLPVARRPFIFMNAVGLVSDVRTLLHESGHAFHNFERSSLPYAQQRFSGLEFAEVASMTMELLTSPYLAEEQGGLYSLEDARRAHKAHLERILCFWPYMAIVDAFQHWVYTHHDQASQPEQCDAKWLELWGRFMPGVDWSGLDEEAMTGWQRKQHIHSDPFYYIEYGVAQLGAVQVWGNALQDQSEALRRYRQALSLGGTASLPDLYRAAGAKLAFDADTLGQAVSLVETQLETLDSMGGNDGIR